MDLPRCQQGSLQIIAAITDGEVIRKILRHLKLSVDPLHGPWVVVDIETKIRY